MSNLNIEIKLPKSGTTRFGVPFFEVPLLGEIDCKFVDLSKIQTYGPIFGTST